MESKIVVYIHRSKRMVDQKKNKFLKSERPRIEVSINKKEYFMYIDEFPRFIIDNFMYGGKYDI